MWTSRETPLVLAPGKSLVPRVICGVDPVVWTMKDDKGMQASAGSFASTGLQQASVPLQYMHFSSSILF